MTDRKASGMPRDFERKPLPPQVANLAPGMLDGAGPAATVVEAGTDGATAPSPAPATH
jgi:hypothetical protein